MDANTSAAAPANGHNSADDHRFRHEEQLFDRTLAPPSEHPSLIFFTVHKAASAYVAHLLSRIARSQSIFSLDLAGYAQEKLNATSHRREVEFYMQCIKGGDHFPAGLVTGARPREIFLSKGCYYGAVRSPDICSILPHQDEFKLLLHLRDPLDALTSLYYSVRYSHAVPGDPQVREDFEKKRQRVAAAEIDEYVLEQAPNWAQRYDFYCRALLGKPNLLLVKYEEMVTDFPQWLNRILAFWEIEIAEDLMQALLAEANFDVEKEDVYSHKRQITPGDHRRKLKPATIAKLTEYFRSSLAQLGYSHSALPYGEVA